MLGLRGCLVLFLTHVEGPAGVKAVVPSSPISSRATASSSFSKEADDDDDAEEEAKAVGKLLLRLLDGVIVMIMDVSCGFMCVGFVCEIRKLAWTRSCLWKECKR